MLHMGTWASHRFFGSRKLHNEELYVFLTKYFLDHDITEYESG